MSTILEKRIQLMILYFRWTYKVANHPHPDSDLHELGKAFLYDCQRKKTGGNITQLPHTLPSQTTKNQIKKRKN